MLCWAQIVDVLLIYFGICWPAVWCDFVVFLFCFFSLTRLKVVLIEACQPIDCKAGFIGSRAAIGWTEVSAAAS